jgi:hypothetical protein
MNKEPVYPKQDPEYRKRTMEQFYKSVRDTKWNIVEEGEYQGKPRGRKAKFTERPKAQLRPGEGYNWLN